MSVYQIGPPPAMYDPYQQQMYTQGPSAPHSSTKQSKAAQAAEEKKGRKPYTITKPRESWTKEEHQFFLEALQLYERDWKKIGQHIPTKSIIQIRSHAQKYFIKMAKMGLKDFIPAPSRPKRAPKSSGKKHKNKRQKTSDDGDGEGGEEDDDGEDEDDEEGEDGEEEEGEEGGEEGGGMDTGELDDSAAPSPSTNGLIRRGSSQAQSSPNKPGALTRQPSSESARKRPPPSMSRSSSSTAASSSTARKPAMRRTTSTESQTSQEGGVDDGTRRSGRKRKMKKRFDDEEYGSADEEEQLQQEEDENGDDGEGHNETMQPGEEEIEGGEEHHQAYNNSHPPTPQETSAPTTPLRKTVPGAVGSLSALSPLSQLTQAGSLANITSPHLLPASAANYNPNLKPYPGLHRSRGAGGMQSNLTLSQNSLSLPATHQTAAGATGGSLTLQQSQLQQQHPHLRPDDDHLSSSLQPGDEEDESQLRPEFAKVYSFLGSVFDPSTSNHTDDLDKMSSANKAIIGTLMQNLTNNLAANPTPTLSSAPKHVRTGSLGSIGSMDALDRSPELSHRWLDATGPLPSVSPTPPQSTTTLLSSTGSSTSLANSSPQPYGLPRSFSSNGLSLNIIPPGSGGGGTSSSLSSLPPSGASSGWSGDKSRPGFASSALMARITARGSLSPLSVAPLSSNSGWPASGQPSPTAPGPSSSMTYSNYSYANMSPSTNTPLSFIGSPGGFFSPAINSGSTGTGVTMTAGAIPESNLPQYPTTTVKPEPTTTAASTSTSTSTTTVTLSAMTSTPTPSPRPSPLTTTTPPHTQSSPPGGVSGGGSISGVMISPSSAGNVLVSLLGAPPIKTLDLDAPVASTTNTVP